MTSVIESHPPIGCSDDAVRQWRLPHTLTILPTYKCTAACKECCFQSNPRITHRVPQRRLLDYVDQAAELGTIRLVCFSGGEAFLLHDDLVELVERCTHHRFLTRAVTNGYWATSERAARRRLSPLVEAGLNEINFSTGDDHVAYVPLERIARGMHVALQYGLGMAVMVEARAARNVTRQTLMDACARYGKLVEAIESGHISIVESPWMPFSEGGAHIAQPSHAVANRANVHARGPCTSVLTTVVVTPGEKLGMCCGLPREAIPDLHAGSLREHRMKELYGESSHDFLKIWLFVEGPERILAWAATKDNSIDWENKYAHNCDACRAMYQNPRVMHAIERHYREKLDEVLLKYALYHAGSPPSLS